MIAKTDKISQEKKLQTHILLTNTDVENLNKILANHIKQHIKSIMHHGQGDLMPVTYRAQHEKINQCNTSH